SARGGMLERLKSRRQAVETQQNMIGAIARDIIGSVHEYAATKTRGRLNLWMKYWRKPSGSAECTTAIPPAKLSPLLCRLVTRRLPLFRIQSVRWQPSQS